jgi:hypothetical protein
MPNQVQVPAAAVSGDDIVPPTRALLEELFLLPTAAELKDARGVSSAFRSPPESVALIEAGATAATKWWAAGLGTAVVGGWAAVRGWWGGAAPTTQHIALWVGAIVTAAAVLGIAHLMASDVRGRAAVATETVRARASVAETFVRMAEQAFGKPASRTGGSPTAAPAADAGVRLVALPFLRVENVTKPGAEERGWRAVALLTDGADRVRYLVVKDTAHEWVDATSVKIQ